MQDWKLEKQFYSFSAYGVLNVISAAPLLVAYTACLEVGLKPVMNFDMDIDMDCPGLTPFFASNYASSAVGSID